MALVARKGVVRFQAQRSLVALRLDGTAAGEHIARLVSFVFLLSFQGGTDAVRAPNTVGWERARVAGDGVPIAGDQDRGDRSIQRYVATHGSLWRL